MLPLAVAGLVDLGSFEIWFDFASSLTEKHNQAFKQIYQVLYN